MLPPRVAILSRSTEKTFGFLILETKKKWYIDPIIGSFQSNAQEREVPMLTNKVKEIMTTQLTSAPVTETNFASC